jgi:hypothetical protein
MAVPPSWAECFERAEHASTRRTYGGALRWIVTQFGIDLPAGHPNGSRPG